MVLNGGRINEVKPSPEKTVDVPFELDEHAAAHAAFLWDKAKKEVLAEHKEDGLDAILDKHAPAVHKEPNQNEDGTIGDTGRFL
jgi:hypothetical protein